MLSVLTAFLFLAVCGLSVKLAKADRALKEKNAEIHRLAMLDNLTGLYNHRYFHEGLDAELAAARSSGGALALILLDIDYFKNYNEVFGHFQGDEVLRTVGEILARGWVDKQIAARYGGEEFAIICPGLSAREAYELAERIRNTIANHPFPGREEQPRGKVTVSIGIAHFPTNAVTRDELVKYADEALYRAKNKHRNRVELYFSVLDELKMQLSDSEQDLLYAIKTIVMIINAKDKYTYGHSERVMDYAGKIARELDFSDEDLKFLEIAAFIHDIGKIEVGSETLNKAKPLSDRERFRIKQHTVRGAEAIRPIKALRQVVPLVRHHHERYDGQGYPDGLAGTDIPLGARVLAVADSFDAMTTQRPYQKPKSFPEAVFELRRCAGSQFDPLIVDAFIRALEKDLASERGPEDGGGRAIGLGEVAAALQ